MTTTNGRLIVSAARIIQKHLPEEATTTMSRASLNRLRPRKQQTNVARPELIETAQLRPLRATVPFITQDSRTNTSRKWPKKRKQECLHTNNSARECSVGHNMSVAWLWLRDGIRPCAQGHHLWWLNMISFRITGFIGIASAANCSSTVGRDNISGISSSRLGTCYIVK